MMAMDLTVAALAAFVVAALGVRLVGMLARRRDLLDRPNWRSSHSTPTPRLGGMGILAGIWAGRALLGPPGEGTDVVLVAASLLAAVGLVDDLWSLSPLLRLALQTGLSVVVVYMVQPALALSIPGAEGTVTGLIADVLVVVWLVGVINIVNFMDGLDGLVGGTAAIAAIGMAVMGGSIPLMVIVAASCVGFLVWNVAPAWIFMGDGGSMLLGVLLGAAVLDGSQPVPVTPTMLILAPLLLDAALTIGIRLTARKPILAAHHDHLYQRLQAMGVQPRVIASGYWLATAACVILALRYAGLPVGGQLAAIVLVVLGFLGYVVLVRQRESSGAGTNGDAPPRLGQKP